MLDAIQSLFPAAVAVAAERVDAAAGALAPAEAAAVVRAVEGRRREFAAGRACAHRALRRLGIENPVVPSSEDRMPVWPEGIVGSISHSGGFCAAAAARKADIAGVGLDIEQTDRLREDLWKMIFRPEEREWLRERPAGERIRWATLLFSAKEAFFKFQYPRTRRWVGFEEASVRADPESGEFLLTVRASGPAEALGVGEVAGRYRFLDGFVATAIACPSASWAGK